MDRLFQALGDATRRSIVEQLVRGPAPVKTIAEPMAMSLPAVMQHLRVLETAGLIRSDKIGRVRTCQLEPAGLRLAEEWIARQRTLWEQRLDDLDKYLKGPES